MLKIGLSSQQTLASILMTDSFTVLQVIICCMTEIATVREGAAGCVFIQHKPCYFKMKYVFIVVIISTGVDLRIFRDDGAWLLQKNRPATLSYLEFFDSV